MHKLCQRPNTMDGFQPHSLVFGNALGTHAMLLGWRNRGFQRNPHAYRKNVGQQVEASVVIPQRDLAYAFRYEEINFFEYQHQTNPAYMEALINSMDIMAYITASMNEHSMSGPNQIAGTSAIVVSATEESVLGTFTNWFENFKVYSFIILLIAIFLLIARTCYAIGFCGLILKSY
ncbi:hypothetical protein OUZ56_026490 [Daphnia magna]|uniref:Uncharacterized protein n=1 Tax=Daphnia magna TaxID=35525 RepID=A0ABQ9ZLX0_9CRUS|nr:hypothetical protein OUZ56_026490 [Daphnia magna]